MNARVFWKSLLVVLAIAGLALITATRLDAQQAVAPCGIVLVADGAGDSTSTSEGVNAAVTADRLPLQVYRWPWSHGRNRALADQTDQNNLIMQGRRLAEYIVACRQHNPHAPIYLVGHSAGAQVVLYALECLPPGSVERAFLLAPSTSCCYDVRPALRAVKCGLHNYYSHHDWFVLGLATRIVGTADGNRGMTAGRFGFNTYAGAPEENALYSKFYQRPWTSQDRALGHNGNHYGYYQPTYLRSQVTPWMR